MNKQTDPARDVTAADLESYVRKDSDFAFEMRVLYELRSLGFDCSHSGTYRDPVTGKLRQFDIRAKLAKRGSTLALAVECKNFRPSAPLLISCVPRIHSEAFNDLIEFPQSALYPRVGGMSAGRSAAYIATEPVGKKIAQVKWKNSGQISGNDELTFEKMNQAINSCRDLVHEYATEAVSSGPFRQAAIIPVVVVPDERLWQVEYAQDGVLTRPPYQVKRVDLFLDHAWEVSTNSGDPLSYRLSHVEFVTLSALKDFPGVRFSRYGFVR